MSGASRRTPDASLQSVFSRAADGLPEPDTRAEVVADALAKLQRGFDAHYAAPAADDEDILAGDDAYAQAVETIACLDEPRFVSIAARMIRDGAGEVSGGKQVSLALWTPHLAGLLSVISGESEKRSLERILAAANEANH